MASVYLGVDIGTTSAKCMAVSEKGEQVAFAQQAYPLTHPRQGWAEQDTEDYWRALVSVVRECTRTLERDFKPCPSIAALAMSTQGDTLIVTDESGLPLLPAITWMDGRGEAEFDELLSEAGASFWYRETGSPLNALSSACKIRWLQRNVPEIAKSRPRYCYVADYLAKRLCGEFVTDTPSASWTPLFTPSTRRYSEAVLEALGIDRDRLSDAAESGQIIGDIPPEVARELGLRPGTKLVAGAFDQAAAAYGAGASADGTGVLSCGTAWVLYVVSGGEVVDPNERLCTCCHAAPGTTALVLPFSGGSTYDWLNRTVRDAGGEPRAEVDSPIFIPHLYGGLSPDWRAESRGSLIGLTLAHTAGDVRLALMRGLAYETRRNLEAATCTLRSVGQVRRIRMVGGAGKSATWPQIIANVLRLPVEVSECVESACFGAAMLAAGTTEFRTRDEGRTFYPDGPGAEVEDRLYARYLQAYSAMLPLYSSERTNH